MKRSFFSPAKNIFVLFFLLIFSMSYGQEICNNAIDDDGDGLIDLNDSTDCICGVGTPTVVPSIIPNPSFELMNYCPSTYSQMDAATGWIQATDATADYMNTCDFVMPAVTASGGLPFPNGNGIAGAIILQDYKEYIGACLLSPMIAGTPYKISFRIASTSMDNFGTPCGSITYGPLDISIFGASSCSSLPVSGYDCPSTASSAWSLLGATNYTPTSTWGIITVTFTPTTTINTIMMGAPCTLPASYGDLTNVCYPYFYYDNLILNESSQFGSIDLSSAGHYCSNNLVITANISTTVTPSAVLQWYHNGVAIIGANSLTYNVPAGSAGLGNYQIRLTDGALCALSPIYEVTPTPPVISVNDLILCPSTSGVLQATGICTSYTWSTGATTSSITVSPTIPTTYTVTGSLGSCVAQATSSVTIFGSPSVSGNTLICNGESTTLTATGGNFYFWSEPGLTTLDDYFSDVVVATPTVTTTYTISVTLITPSTFCATQTVVTVVVSPAPTLTINPSISFICAGGSVTLTASSSGASTYTWSTGANSPSIVVSPTVNIVLTASTSIGQCIGYDIAQVITVAPIITVNSPTICYGQAATLIASGAISYTWSNGSMSSTQTVSPTSSTTYSVTGTNGFSCTSTKVSTVTVIHPVANFSGISNGTSFLQGSQFGLTNTSLGATTYLWELCDAQISTNKDIYVLAGDTGYCCIKLFAFEKTCVDSISTCYRVLPDVYIPNVFTPNGDGKNDIFRLNPTGLTQLTCSIFDRWGLKLYEWNGVNGGWNGVTTSGSKANDGTYFFILTYTDVNEKSKTEKGFLTLFRD